jgi:hypothetical protein
MTAESGQEFDELGWTMTILPDFNGDGSPDLAAAGRQGALMWFGGAALDSIPDRDWPSSGQVSRPLAASAGDWNGDGYGDFVCAAAPGGVQVVFGGPGADTNVDRTLGAPDYAFSIAGGGDLNGDGYDDIAVGFAGGTSGSGRVEVYFGGATADSIGDLTLFPPLPDATFGWSTAIAGDVNGDGYADLAVGSWWNDGAVHSGRVYVYLGGPQFDAVVDDTLESAGAFGMSLAGLGDVTGDGRADLAIGSLYEPNPGQVYVVSFSSDVGSPPPGPVVDALHLSVRGNPARGEVHLALALDRDAPVTLTIHDLAGREVARPLDHARVAGGTETTWSPGPLPAGVYLARLSVGDRSAVARCVWLGP